MRLLYTLSILLPLLCGAQQDPQFTHFNRNVQLYNPGATGVQYDLQVGIFGRKQWTGFDGAPTTFGFHSGYNIESINSGVGLSYYYDDLGFETNNVIKLNYTYELLVGSGSLGIGVSPSFFHKTIDNSQWITPGVPAPLDPSIPSESSDQVFDFGFGLFYQSNKFQVGVSATNLLESEFDDLNIQGARHYYVFGQYHLVLNPKFELFPAVLFKSDVAASQLDFLATLQYDQKYWAQLGYRMQDAVTIGGGVRIARKYEIGYAYDATISKLSAYSNGSHEIVLRMILDRITITPTAGLPTTTF